MSVQLNRELLSRLSEYISAHIGLHFSEDRWANLAHGIGCAAEESGFSSVEDFARWLLGAPLNEEQQEMLTGHLTIGETYFFRDQEIFWALRDLILPDLIRSRKASGEKIRFWSAACCTGEEPYSLAMIIDQMVLPPERRLFRILATDINKRFLEKARRGVYTPWSFRRTPDWATKRYFKSHEGKTRKIASHIKSMVDFRQLNLAEPMSTSPKNEIEKFDVIFCRNVLIYFSDSLRIKVIDRLCRCLAPGGLLIFSPCETAYVRHADLTTVGLSHGTLFKKADPVLNDTGGATHPESSPAAETFFVATSNRNRSDSAPAIRFLGGLQADQTKTSGIEVDNEPEIPLPAEQKEPSPQIRMSPCPVAGDPADEALKLFRNGDLDSAAEKILEMYQGSEKNGLFDNTKTDNELLSFAAKILADHGLLREARDLCDRAIAREKLEPGHYYLMATICQEQERFEEAARFLKKALYLDSNFVLAHVALGSVNRKLKKDDAARRNLSSALSLLTGMEPDQEIPLSGGLTARRLLELARCMSREEQSA